MALFKKTPDEKINTKKIVITTMIGSDTTVEGTVITKNSIRIDGEVVGGVTCAGVAIISKGARIKGDVFAENVIVAGVVEGVIKATEKVNIEPSGEVYGDIITNKLLVDAESIFLGKSYMNRGKGENRGEVVDELVFSNSKNAEKNSEESKAPEAKKAESKKPEIKKAEVKKQEVKKPELKVPETKKPEQKKHEVKKVNADKAEAKKSVDDINIVKIEDLEADEKK